MANGSKPSFSPYRKWGIGFNVALIVIVVFAVIAMANYLSHSYFARFHLSGLTRNELSPRTHSVLNSLTNTVKIILYYDKNEPMYSTVADIVNEYKLASPRISVQIVDFLRDPGAAQKVQSDYKLAPPADKNLVIFDCDGRFRIVNGAMLTKYTLELMPSETDREYRRKPTAFLGETMFTAAILHVIQPEPLKACFLQGHGEHRLDSADPVMGYSKFIGLLMQNYIEPRPLSLLGTNEIPDLCNLLIIAGPSREIPAPEIEKIEKYLAQGKRLMVLFNVESVGKVTGLEAVLAKWGVRVGNDFLVDPDHTSSGSDVIVSAFSKHEMVNPLLGSGLFLIRPRPVGRIETEKPPADAPKVEEVAWTGEKTRPSRSPSSEPHRYPVVAVVEKSGVKGVIAEQGATRIVVAGDSYFLGNNQLDLLGNRDFASAMVNWLLERNKMLEGVAQKSVSEYRLVLTSAQLEKVRWLLLGLVPGGILLAGVMVHWRRNR